MIFIVPSANDRVRTTYDETEYLRARVKVLEAELTSADTNNKYLRDRNQVLECHCYRLQNELDSVKIECSRVTQERDDYATLYEVNYARLAANLQNKSYARLVAWLEKEGLGHLLEDFHGCEEPKKSDSSPKKGVKFTDKQSPVHHPSTGVGGMKRGDFIPRKKKKNTISNKQLKELMLM